MRYFLYIILNLIAINWFQISNSVAQTISKSPEGFYIPQNLAEANQQLDQTLTSKAKAKFRQLTPADFENVTGIFLLNEWDDENSRLVHYLNQYIRPQEGIWQFEDYQLRNHLILLSYLRHLRNEPFDLIIEAQKLNSLGQNLAEVAAKQHQLNLVADSIEGIYIPLNLAECFRELDKMLPDSIKQQIRLIADAKDLGAYHFGLGMWLRNNWGLWGGSRLQVYFEQHNVMHPDYMSGIILNEYWRYQKGDKIKELTIQPKQELKPVIVDQPNATVAQPKPDRKGYSKAYRKFLRLKKINDFDCLPPEAYGQSVEIQ